MTHRAIVATEVDGRPHSALAELSDEDLPEGDVTVSVLYSSLNYKDGLAVSGKGRIIRSFPMVCGIDLAGTVERSDSPRWKVGDEVVLTGWGLSESHPGGYTQRQRVRSEWLVPRPDGLSLLQSMAVGTAGLTAMLCVLALEHGGLRRRPAGDGGDEVLVTGAAGGVGSVAVAVLASLGHTVAASTGRPETHDFLRSLGAATLIDRQDLATASGRPLDRERWAAAVDVVGGETLATVLRQTRYRGTVAACGLTGGNDLPTTVLPFILRGVTLAGVDSVSCPTDLRTEAWHRLGQDLPTDLLDSLTTVEPLSRVPALADDIVAGRTRGRVVIDVNA
ncbi:MAG TPA: MDR family oxidoreductase [Acidimicrobiales bacterium]|nr:MDR family oxidoreductase [Acidimicrobiales bacterium]